MMNIAATEFWLNHVYRPIGTRAHGLLESDDALLGWLGERDPEAVIQQAVDEARIIGRNPSVPIVRYVLAQRLCKLATRHVLSDVQSRFVAAQIPQAPDESAVIRGYADGRTTQDWLEFMDASVNVRKLLREGQPTTQVTKTLQDKNGGLNLDPLFIRAYVKDNAPRSGR